MGVRAHMCPPRVSPESSAKAAVGGTAFLAARGRGRSRDAVLQVAGWGFCAGGGVGGGGGAGAGLGPRSGDPAVLGN